MCKYVCALGSWKDDGKGRETNKADHAYRTYTNKDAHTTPHLDLAVVDGLGQVLRLLHELRPGAEDRGAEEGGGVRQQRADGLGVLFCWFV